MRKAGTYIISREQTILRIDFKRSPDRKTMIQLLEQLSELENSELRMYVMIDAEILLSTAEVREGAEYAREMKNQPRRVAVVAAGEITYGISRIFKVFRESGETELMVFREIDQARDWLLS